MRRPRHHRAALCRALACAGALGIGLPAQAQAQEEGVSRYAATAALSLSPSAGGLQRVALPLALLQASRSPGWADVRIFNAAGAPVPLAWAGAPPAAEPAAPREVALPRFAWPGAVEASGPAASAPITLRLRADGAVLEVQGRAAAAPASGTQAWLLDLQPLGRERPAALRLDWPAAGAGLERRARVQASRDAQSWQDAGSATLVEVPGAGGASALRQARIELQGLEAQRYLRLVVAGGAFTLRAVWAELPTARAEAPLDSARFPLRPDGERAWRLDAGTPLPARRLQVHLAEDNAVAPLQLLRRAPPGAGRAGADWLPVAALSAYRLQREGATLQAPPLALDGEPVREWRLVLDARVSVPAAAPEATLWWRAPQLVFAARGEAPFTLAVGRERAAAVTLPLATLVPGWTPGAEFKLPAATPGALVPKAASAGGWLGALRDAAPEQQRQWLLWALLAGAVAVLGVLAWRLGRDMNASAGSPPR